MIKSRTLATALALAVPLVAQGQASYPPERWFDDRWYLTPFGTLRPRRQRSQVR